MNFISRKPAGLVLLTVLTMAAPAGLAAQPQELSAADTELTVYGTPPADLSGFEEGPEIEGFISARGDNKIQITTVDGSGTTVFISDATQIKAAGGFLGLGRKQLGRDALLNGLPVAVETVQWGNGLVASEVALKNKDLKTATMIRSGTSQRFAEQGAAIDENAAATDALRGRMGDIDKYNIKGTTNVYFDTGKWKLTPGAESNLCTAARDADAMDNALLLVVGYTDSVGSQEFNQQLSEKRAGRVVNYLQQACGWKPWRMLTPTGMAEADPLASNDTEAGKAQNRRVSVNILVSKGLDGL